MKICCQACLKTEVKFNKQKEQTIKGNMNINK